VRTLLLPNEETGLKTGKSAVRTDGRINALGNACDLPASACRPYNVAPHFPDSIPYDLPGLLRLGNRHLTGNYWRCDIKGHSLSDCKCPSSPEECAGKHFSKWLPGSPAALPPLSFPAAGGWLISSRARDGTEEHNPRYRSAPALSYGQPVDQRLYHRSVLQPPTAPLHTLATFLPNMETSDLHMLAMGEQKRAWESKETARLWKEEVVSDQEVIVHLTQNLVRLTPA